ncbi:hypothetical protein A3B60_03640 [Candidatus Peregrinibacteria bacterium RIFCSPLOWO2_01_FULL_39_12]|nr:MAG: hypothetical protein A3B60_03640 [Candidatus Peregrinibacteria bacterium RIFCSPLOWO2_01_FULL_39_12]
MIATHQATPKEFLIKNVRAASPPASRVEANTFTVECGHLKIDMLTRRFFVGSNFIFLRNKEFSLITYFVKNIGRVVSRTQILEEVWDRNIFCPTNTVDVHVSSLRRKIKKHLKHDLIKTVHCVGYIFEI